MEVANILLSHILWRVRLTAQDGADLPHQIVQRLPVPDRAAGSSAGNSSQQKKKKKKQQQPEQKHTSALLILEQLCFCLFLFSLRF